MRRIFVTTAIATLLLMMGTEKSFAQAYPRDPYDYRPGNARMGIGPGGREAYQPQYYSSVPNLGYGLLGYGWGMYGGYGYGPANSFPNVTGMPSEPAAAPDEAYIQHPAPRSSRAMPRNPNVAAIDVRVPAGTQLTFQGQPTKQQGSVRLFESPPLQPGQTYAYKVKTVRTNANGEIVERTRTVQVHAGDYVKLDLRQE
jgi:uncharacterized protein (TIGR03000 family)